MIVLYHFKLVKYEKFGQFMVFLGLSQFLPVYPKTFLPVYPTRFIPWDKPPLPSLFEKERFEVEEEGFKVEEEGGAKI